MILQGTDVRDTFMALASETASKVRPDYDIPVEMRKRKRGKKGGVRARLRKRKFRPALPSIVTGNCRSLRNKLDELKACVNYRYEYRDSCMMCFSETWFSPRDSESSTAIEGFTCVRNDRTSDSGKSMGGGVCAYVNERWCNASNISVKAHHCSQDIELLCIGIRPHYLPIKGIHSIICYSCIHPAKGRRRCSCGPDPECSSTKRNCIS